jgi:hypothetical protein
MERCGQSIQVYLPFIAETQDEKMFRVVLDREKWFNVIMGERIETSFAATEKLAERLPLPDRIVEDLIFDFSVIEPAHGSHSTAFRIDYGKKLA